MVPASPVRGWALELEVAPSLPQLSKELEAKTADLVSGHSELEAAMAEEAGTASGEEALEVGAAAWRLPLACLRAKEEVRVAEEELLASAPEPAPAMAAVGGICRN